MEEWRTILRRKIQKLANEIEEHVGPDAGLSSPFLEVPQIEDRLVRIYKRIERGVHKIADLLNDPHWYGDHSHLIHSMADMATIASVVVRQMGPSLSMIGQGASLQEVLGISDSDIDSLYQLTRALYDQQLYEEATGVFYLLALLNPSCALFWIGLGNSEYFLGRYQEALVVYAFAIQVDAHNPSAYLLSAYCHRALGNYSAAHASLGIAELCVQDSHESEAVRRQIALLRNSLGGHHGANS